MYILFLCKYYIYLYPLVIQLLYMSIIWLYKYHIYVYYLVV